MSSYLELCQEVARESGTMASTTINSVTGQTGRPEKVVEWVAEAWKQIQNKHTSWRFRRTEFTAPLIVNTGLYTPAALSLNNVSEFIYAQDCFTAYRDSVGVAEEYALTPLPWADFKRTYRRGTQTSAPPSHYSIAPDGSLAIGPAPAEATTIKGEYVRTAQILSANGDIPICPVDYHSIIVWYAIVHLAEHDEGAFQVATADRKYKEYYNAMARSQLPTITIGGPTLA